MAISISDAKRIGEELGLTHVVIFGIDSDGTQYIATHGESEHNANEACVIGNNLKRILGWPEHLCGVKPMERIHRNCKLYSEIDSFIGNCHRDPVVESVSGDMYGCSKFEPNV